MAVTILWVDDEIDLLKSHILFLEGKGYKVVTSNNGADAIEIFGEHHADVVFLDENMPGLSGLETLSRIKQSWPGVPIVMITKSEEESVMNEAIGYGVCDYLIKPLNPNQILLSLKRNLENKKLVEEKTTQSYQREFRNIGAALNRNLSIHHWKDMYRQLVYWELELDKLQDTGMKEIIKLQKSEANSVFFDFIKDNYLQWLKEASPDRPVLSHLAFREKCLPFIKAENKVFLILIDNLRYDQWKVLQPAIEQYYRVVTEDMYCSILPTATQYARNSFFAGLMPGEIEKRYPAYWVHDSDEGTYNQFENELLGEQLKRLGSSFKYHYHKILNLTSGRKLADTLGNFTDAQLNVLVYNFIDILSHSRTEMEVLKELAETEAAYRSLTVSWFEHSPLHEIFRLLSLKGISIILTTDHGSIKVNNPTRVVGEKNTNTNLRFKTGRNLSFSAKEVLEIKNPGEAYLPKENVSSNYLFAKEDYFFAYPNNFNYYVNYYRSTFQHGGISLEEMLVPLVFLKAR